MAPLGVAGAAAAALALVARRLAAETAALDDAGARLREAADLACRTAGPGRQ